MADQTADPQAMELVNSSIRFLLLLILATLLSLAGLLRQRERLRADDPGEAAGPCGDPYPLQRAAGAITVGALGFFFTLALRGWADARKAGPGRGLRTARVNLWASLLVLAAAVLRLLALDAAHDPEGLPQEADLPA